MHTARRPTPAGRPPIPRVPEAAEPGGWRDLIYYRLHGSPDMYRSASLEEYLAILAPRLQEEVAAGRAVWCIFDNTTLGAATRNALDLRSRLELQALYNPGEVRT